MNSDSDTAEALGCPIRKSMDQSSFAAPHGLSQRTTSFIASYRQGIHQMPLGHLIALISNAHLTRPLPRTLRRTFERRAFGRWITAQKDQKSSR